MATLLARLTKYKARDVLKLGVCVSPSRRMLSSYSNSLRKRNVLRGAKIEMKAMIIGHSNRRFGTNRGLKALQIMKRNSTPSVNGSVGSILAMKRFNSNKPDNKGNGKGNNKGNNKPDRKYYPMVNKYLSLCSNFRYPKELGQKENYRRGFEFVKKYLNKTKSVDDITSPALLKLKARIDSDPIVRMLASRQIEEASILGHIDGNLNISWFLCRLQDILSYSPVCNQSSPADSVTLPLAIFYGPLADTESGEVLSLNDEMNKFWREYLTEWFQFLSSEESAHVLTGPDGWCTENTPGYEYMNMDSFIIPEGGYKSWNEFFYRALKDGEREIASPGNNTIIASAVDAQVWRLYENMKEDATFWIKGQPYHPLTLVNMSEAQASRYIGGNAFQCVLWTEDYHRWHAPVSGKIKSVQAVQGTYFTNLPYQSDLDETSLASYTGSFTYMGHLNTRMVIEIDTSIDRDGNPNSDGNIGHVTFVAVGLQDVSTCTQSVYAGDWVDKGQELGYFQFGGSTVIYMFEQGAINTMDVEIPDDPFETTLTVKMGQQIATANLKA